MRAYDLPLVETFRFAAALTSAVATVGRFTGPAGKQGRVLNLSYVVTTTLTGGGLAPVIQINQSTALTTPPSVTIPALAAANAVGAATKANLKAGSSLEKDLEGRVNVTVLSTTGAADLVVTVGWFD
jgi:hypothetical protein